jgi:hypothetical protein
MSVPLPFRNQWDNMSMICKMSRICTGLCRTECMEDENYLLTSNTRRSISKQLRSKYKTRLSTPTQMFWFPVDLEDTQRYSIQTWRGKAHRIAHSEGLSCPVLLIYPNSIFSIFKFMKTCCFHKTASGKFREVRDTSTHATM